VNVVYDAVEYENTMHHIFFNHTGYSIFVYPTVRSLSSGARECVALHFWHKIKLMMKLCLIL